MPDHLGGEVFITPVGADDLIIGFGFAEAGEEVTFILPNRFDADLRRR